MTLEADQQGMTSKLQHGKHSSVRPAPPAVCGGNRVVWTNTEDCCVVVKQQGFKMGPAQVSGCAEGVLHGR